MRCSFLALFLLPSVALAGPSLADRLGPFDGPLGSKRIGDDPPCVGAYAKRFTHDGRTLISLDELNILRVCDLERGRLVASHVLHVPAEDGYFSPSTARLAVSDDGARVAVLWGSFGDASAHVVAFRTSDGLSDWTSSYSFEAGRVTEPYHNLTFSEDGAELWVVSTDGRSSLVRLSARSGEVLGRVEGVGVGSLYGWPNWGHADGGHFSHPFDVGLRPVGGSLWASGIQGERHQVDPATVQVSTGTLQRWKRGAVPALSTGAAELRWGRASDGSRALLLVRGKRSPIEVPVALPDSVKSLARERPEVQSTLLWAPDGRSLSVSTTAASLELDMRRGRVIGEWSPNVEGAVRVLAPPGGPLGLAWMPEAHGLYRVDVFDRTGEVLRSVRDSGRIRPDSVRFLPDDSGVIVEMPDHLEVYPLPYSGVFERVQPALAEGQTLGHLVGLIDAHRALVTLFSSEDTSLAVMDLDDGGVTPFHFRGDRSGRNLTQVSLHPGTGRVAVATYERSRRAGEIALFQLDGAVLWRVPHAHGQHTGVQFSGDGSVLRIKDTYLSASDGSGTKWTAMDESELITTPGQQGSGWTARSHDGSLIAEASMLGSLFVWRDPGFGETEAVREAIERVRAAPAVTDAQIKGRWKVERAMVNLYNRSETHSEVSDYSKLVGLGGFRFESYGVYMAGLMQMAGRWKLDKRGHGLRLIDARQRVERYDLRVDGDVMEWIIAEPPSGGDFRVETWVRLVRE